MSNKKRQQLKLPTPGIMLALVISAIPLWLFASWIRLVILEANNQSGVVMAQNYQFCKTSDAEVEFGKIREGIVPEVIQIDSVGINLPIESKPLVNGTWEVSDNIANFAQGTSLINGIDGNVGIYGHDRDNVLGKIKDLKKDDEVVIYSGSYKVTYKVEDSFVSDPNNVDVFYHTDEPFLTLATCDGIFSRQRYIVRAKFNGIQEINCNE